ncbi:MAG: hypothetical protein Q9160_002168 [Pyrenula sp. 1 TL-2023]
MGGGHGSSRTLGKLRNGLKIDMGNFHTVNVNASANLMTTGGSVTGADVTSALQVAGKEIPVGQCFCVGFTGAALGGGIGPYSGLYGAVSDSLISVKMVTGTGDLITVSAKEHPELLWGLKAAGYNFGIVTSLTYRVYDATNDGLAMNADLVFPGNMSSALWAVAQSFVGNQPRELAITFAVRYDPQAKTVLITAGLIYAGPLAQGRQVIQPFLDLRPTILNISTVPYKDISRSTIFGSIVKGCMPGNNFIPYAVNLYQIDVDDLKGVVDYMQASIAAEPQLERAFLEIYQYAPYGFQLYGDADSAFSGRDVVMFASINGFLRSPLDAVLVDPWAQDLRDRLQQGSGRDKLHTYVNLANGDEGPEAWYGEEKLGRLRALKRRYDPEGLFGFYNDVGGV